jgi:hypothetical protein
MVAVKHLQKSVICVLGETVSRRHGSPLGQGRLVRRMLLHVHFSIFGIINNNRSHGEEQKLTVFTVQHHKSAHPVWSGLQIVKHVHVWSVGSQTRAKIVKLVSHEHLFKFVSSVARIIIIPANILQHLVEDVKPIRIKSA